MKNKQKKKFNSIVSIVFGVGMTVAVFSPMVAMIYQGIAAPDFAEVKKQEIASSNFKKQQNQRMYESNILKSMKIHTTNIPKGAKQEDLVAVFEIKKVNKANLPVYPGQYVYTPINAGINKSDAEANPIGWLYIKDLKEQANKGSL
jgi:hypothetical protein